MEQNQTGNRPRRLYRRACRRANHLINSSRQNYFRDQLSNATDAIGVDGVLLSDYCTQTALLNPAPSTNFSDCVPYFPVISSQKSQHSNRLLPKLPTTLPSRPTRSQPTLVRCLTHSTLSLQLKFSSFSLPFHQKTAQWISSPLF